MEDGGRGSEDEGGGGLNEGAEVEDGTIEEDSEDKVAEGS